MTDVRPDLSIAKFGHFFLRASPLTSSAALLAVKATAHVRASAHERTNARTHARTHTSVSRFDRRKNYV
jgi:hypothetical protein